MIRLYIYIFKKYVNSDYIMYAIEYTGKGTNIFHIVKLIKWCLNTQRYKKAI